MYLAKLSKSGLAGCENLALLSYILHVVFHYLKYMWKGTEWLPFTQNGVVFLNEKKRQGGYVSEIPRNQIPWLYNLLLMCVAH